MVNSCRMLKGATIILVLSVVLQRTAATYADRCNEDVCGSIVSKCSLTQSCQCEQKNSTCYRDCVMCMGKKQFQACCGCVDLCPKLSKSITHPLLQKSHVEDFEGVPELFDVLVSSPTDSLEYNWNILTFLIDLKEVLPNRTRKPDTDHGVVNCTVVYFDNCVSWNKCRQSCRSTGASGYRWFHDGCCECVGSTCINYGVNESRCRHCPEAEEDDEDEFDNADDNDDFYAFELFDDNEKDNSI